MIKYTSKRRQVPVIHNQQIKRVEGNIKFSEKGKKDF